MSTPCCDLGAEMIRRWNCHDDLLAALRCFLDDPRFQVGVGGNPIVVERMIGQARAAIAKATGE